MVLLVDARLPVEIRPPHPGATAGAAAALDADAETALLIEGEAAPLPGRAVAHFRPGTEGLHDAGCACCRPRAGVAMALSHLLIARARGEVPFFRRVLALPATAAGEAAIRAALRGDPLLAARYRPA